ncbi:hypothetical protein [Mesorhizobium qingshengii]|uniref:Carboxypeptidase regulatory-like domain-containing protein n=1 Tax=Mesorhizobium qingshengii TaxID=1165689 RepID=A0A1G5ZR04_9HYPH|nr:hypothetical protein [Mesorhizobium qingshengii]SDA97000.1 hypothetical protein SAMN02927914_05777 [Mesorhizobium qingshengii]
MAGRLLPSLGLVALGAGLGMSFGAFGESTNFSHLGQVIEYQTGRPVEAAIKAWPQSVRTGRDGDCSLYGDTPLDSRRSDGDGHFQLEISSESHTYTVTYCASGFVPRDDRDLPNDRQGEVLPTPARLWPIKMSEGDAVAFNQAVASRLVFSLNEIAYLRKVDTKAFQQIVDQIAERSPDGDTIQALSSLAGLWDK